MPKQVLQVTNFAGGLNAYSDARDIEDNQFVQNWNAVVDKDGIIRVSGMAEDVSSMITEYFDNTNFQKGHGLFQFTTDYSLSEIDGNFSAGIKTGTLSAYASGTPSVTLESGVAAQASNYYLNWTIYIYSGPGKGESRKITASSTASPPVLTISVAFADASTGSSSKYIIYRWTPNSNFNFKFNDTGYSDDYVIEDLGYDYSFLTKSGNVTTNTSSNLGYLQYEPNLTLKPGVRYTASFECKALTQYFNDVSDGNETGTVDTGITTDNSSGTTVSATTASVTIDVDNGGSGSIGADLAAMQVLILNKDVYDENGIFIGTCTAVAYTSTSDGTVTFGNGIDVDIANNTDLYVGGFGDKVPWVQLYSTTVADTRGSIKTFTVASPSDVWGTSIDGSGQYTHIPQEETSGTGTGATFHVITDGSGNPTVRINSVGQGYKDTDTLVIKDTPDTEETIVITVASVNVTGLSLLCDDSDDSIGHSWVSGIEGDGSASNYLTNVESNYIDNGDFRTTYSTEWSLVNHDSGSAHGLAAAEVSDVADKYDNVDGSLFLSTTVDAHGFSAGWLSQTLTLDELTSYNLNFLYSARTGDSGGEFRVITSDGENAIDYLAGTFLTGTTDSTTPVYKFVRWAEAENDSNPDLTNNFSYIQFKTPKSTTGSTLSVKVQFRPINGVSGKGIFLHGVTVYKNHFDLSNMSYLNPEASNPFLTQVKEYSKYSFSFVVPSNYSEVSDWVFRIYAGKYGWRDDNDLNDGSESSQSQDIYIKNIKISSDTGGGDTVTLLTDNSLEKSSILAHTSSSNVWERDFFTWTGLESQPCYTYIDGMLKISDGNFKTNNGEKFLYYSKESSPENNIFPSWVKQSYSVPPSITSLIFEHELTPMSSYEFDAIPALNNFFAGKKYRESAASPYNTNWPMDSFGPENSTTNTSLTPFNHTGLMMRSWIANDISGSGGARTNHKGNLWSDGIKGNGQASPYTNNTMEGYMQVYDPDTEWFGDNIGVSGGGSYMPTPTYSNYMSNLGINPRSRESENQMAIQFYWTSNDEEKVRNPISIAIDNTFDGFTHDDFDNELGNIAKVKIRFEYEYVGFQGYWNLDDYGTPPSFNIRAGKVSESGFDIINAEYGGNLLDCMVDGNPLEFDAGTRSIYTGNILRDASKTDKWSSLYEICDLQNFSRYDTREVLKGAYIGRGIIDPGKDNDTFRGLSERYPLQVKLDIEKTLTWSQGSSNINPQTDTLLLNIKEYLSHGGNAENGVHASNLGSADAGLHFGLGYAQGSGSPYWDQGYDIKFLSHFSWLPSDGRSWAPPDDDPQMFQRMFIKELTIQYYQQEENLSVDLGSGNVGINFHWDELGLEGVGWAERKFKLATTTVNVFGEESAFSESGGTIGHSPTISVGDAPNIMVIMRDSHLNNRFLSKTKFYMRDTESDIWYLQFYIDHEEQKLYSSTSSISANAVQGLEGEKEWELGRENFKNFNEVDSYSAETLISQEDGKSQDNLTARYKTSVVANNRMYVGNIMQNGKIYGDRVLISPLGKYNILPASDFLDVAINDGDDITALAYYKDKILTFKKRKVFAINISGDYRFIEDTFDNVGVLHQASVTKTPHGIVWANKTGCYLYDGSKMTNLIDNKIPATSDYANVNVSIYNYWFASASDGDCVVGYIQDRDTLLIKWTAAGVVVSAFTDAVSYHFPTKSWIFNFNSIAGHTGANNTGDISNMITDINGDLLYYRFQSDTQTYNGMKKWNNASLVTGEFKRYTFTTKDFTFGDIANRKKIYKIYVTYKTTDGSDSKILVYAGTNGGSQAAAFSASASKFAGTSTACYSASNGLLDTGGDWKIAELRFTTSSTFNNIYSFQLQFLGSTTTDSGFEINDISFVFKTKRVK